MKANARRATLAEGLDAAETPAVLAAAVVIVAVDVISVGVISGGVADATSSAVLAELTDSVEAPSFDVFSFSLDGGRMGDATTGVTNFRSCRLVTAELVRRPPDDTVELDGHAFNPVNVETPSARPRGAPVGDAAAVFDPRSLAGVESETTGDVLADPFGDPSDDAADAEEEAPSSAWAMPTPPASEAPRPTVIAPAPIHEQTSGR